MRSIHFHDRADRCRSDITFDSNLRCRHDRGGSALVLGLVLTVAIVILTAITLDFGYIHVAETELRRSADAAAMAGCWELFDRQRIDQAAPVSDSDLVAASNAVASLNAVGEMSALVGDNDLEVGHYDVDGSWSTSDPADFNAVRVTMRRQSGINGELPLFFGQLTGRTQQSLSTDATAAMFNAIEGFYEPPSSDETIGILPIALDLESWLLAIDDQTVDEFTFGGGSVASGSDGIHETNLYPKGTGSPGNRGTVDIGGANNSTNDLSRQILHGISKQDFVDLGRPLKFDANGELDLNGDTGISAGIKDELATLIGKTRVIPIYSRVAGNGNNAMFTIVRWEGVRILDVKLTGKKNDKRVIIQPAKVVGRGTRIDYSGSKRTSHLVTPVMLVQ